MRIIYACFLFFVFAASAQGQFQEDMETDRPDFTEGPKTIEPGHLQVELGYTFIRDDEDGVEKKEHALPGSLLRVGLPSDLEFRLSWDGYSFEELEEAGASRDHDGGTDVAVGGKYRLIEDGDFALSLLAELTLPAGARNKTSDAVEPQLSFLWAYDLTDVLGLAGNVNLSSVIAEDGERIFEPSNSLALAYDLNESFGSYVEYFGFYPTESAEDAEDEHYLNAGLTYAVSSNVQLDTLIGFGLNEDADDLFTGLGLSFRL